MSDELVTRVARWLDAVPHLNGCLSGVCGTAAEYHVYGYPMGCTCDRPQRQAEAVVRLAWKCGVITWEDGCGAPIALARALTAIESEDAVEREAAP